VRRSLGGAAGAFLAVARRAGQRSDEGRCGEAEQRARRVPSFVVRPARGVLALGLAALKRRRPAGATAACKRQCETAEI
jgi:hypothetical protein